MPGFQIAYGALVRVRDSSPESVGPYDKEAMTLFDYRTDHLPDDNTAQKAPTFMYAMPLQGNRIFFEETSLVARPAISFQVCKDRYLRRLQHLGIQVEELEEEEFCYIPMGGPLPEKNQRIVGFGGASAMVHPSTGYTLCRTLMGAVYLAQSILESFSAPSFDPEKAAAEAYHSIWSPENIRQRNFAVFGGEFLMKQDVQGLRGFFDGFFALPIQMWTGFLAGWPGLPHNHLHDSWHKRLWFGLLFVSKLPANVAFDMLASIATYTITDGIALPQSVTPFFGQPHSYRHHLRPLAFHLGDVAAKAEARDMIQASNLTKHLPVAFAKNKKTTNASLNTYNITTTVATLSTDQKLPHASAKTDKETNLASTSTHNNINPSSSPSSPEQISFQ